MRRRERWLTREEHARIREGIANAGGARAWIRAAKPDPEDVRRRHARINALATKCGLAPPYRDADTAGPEHKP